MSYTNYYLKFDDEAQCKQFHDPENNISIDATAVSIIGTVYVPTGTMLTDDEGNEYPEKEAAEGFYVNIRTKQDLPVDLESFVYTPDADFPIPRWASNPATIKTDASLKVPKGDIMAMLSVGSLAAVIGWMRAEADNYALAFHEYFKAHDQFKVADPVFISLINMLYQLDLITEAEKDAVIGLGAA